LFEYFASRLSDLGENNLAKLREAPIVPVVRQSRPTTATSGKSAYSSATVTHISPQSCYLGSSTTYGDIFDFVDFGTDANTFLFRCGAKNEPTKAEIANLACNEPARLLSVLQSPDKYLTLLKSLAESLSMLKRDKDLFRRMKSSPFLLAFREISKPNKEKLIDLEEDDTPIRQYQLAAAGHIVVQDDIVNYRLFKDYLIVAPEEEILEEFYLALGAQTLSSLVQNEVKIGPHSDKQDKAIKLQKHVLERSKIFLHEYSKYRRDIVKHDAKWLEKSLSVEMVRSVALRHTLRGHSKSHTEKRSAVVDRAKSGNAHVLYIATDCAPDMYQIGQGLCQLLLSRPNQQAYLFFEPFLALDLYGLQNRGYNVDRILRAKAAEARIAEEERRKALDAEQAMIREREEDWKNQAKAAEAAREQARTPDPVMPGSFTNDSPEDYKVPIQQGQRKGRSLFSNLSRRFGFENNENDGGNDPINKLLGKPPSGPEQHDDTKEGAGEMKKPKKDDGRVTSPAVVQQNLLNAINSTRSFGSNNLFTNPKVNEVKEQATYCDKTPAQNITFVAEAANGMKVFVSKEMTMDPMKFLSSHLGPINAFAALLLEIGAVYSMSPNVLHIYYDETGSTIAFNTNGSIFCNLRFFLQLHAAKLNGPQQGEAKAEAAVWWWVVLAHELAHNLVQPHNSDHSYYT
jgi:hypothetical protein